MKRTALSIISLVAILAFAGPAWADRCVGPKDSALSAYSVSSFAQSDIVWCDDFDTYCTANDSVVPGGVWPGYPPSPDNVCATDAVASDSWFTNAVYHWPPDGYTGGSQMAMDNTDPVLGWDDASGWLSSPFLARQEGGKGVTAQYHTFNIAGAIGHKFSGSNAINGTDENPLVLRWWAYTPLGVGFYPNTPHYMELHFDDERAPTDYVEWDCGFETDCNCYWSNTDATCNAGTCTNFGTCEQGVCNGGVCDWENDGWYCILGPRIGQSCDNGGNPDDFMCYECAGGEFDGGDCQTYLDCGQKACEGGANDGVVCTDDTNCTGTCATGPKTGQACANNSQCGECVGGQTPGSNCADNRDCQKPCGAGQTATCDGGLNDGQTCPNGDIDCSRGPIYPVINQMEYHYAIPNCPETSPCSKEATGDTESLGGYIITPSPAPDLSTDIVASIAFGWLPHANEEGPVSYSPCNLATGRKPTSYHAETFDGNLWRQLRSNKYLPGYGDFNFAGADGGQAFFQITIKSTVYVLKLVAPITNHTNVIDNLATLPRAYTGPFNKVSMGAGPGCRLDGSGNCATGYDVFRYPSYSYNRNRFIEWADAWLDRPVLLGGVGNTSEAACCDTEGGCTVTTSANCTGTWKGLGTDCDPNPCCPQVWADTDRDGDVDQDDFSAFQLCFSGAGTAAPAECHCWDRDTSGAGDGDVDADDYSVFNTCWTGPNVPYNLGSLPTGCE